MITARTQTASKSTSRPTTCGSAFVVVVVATGTTEVSTWTLKECRKDGVVRVRETTTSDVRGCSSLLVGPVGRSFEAWSWWGGALSGHGWTRFCDAWDSGPSWLQPARTSTITVNQPTSKFAISGIDRAHWRMAGTVFTWTTHTSRHTSGITGKRWLCGANAFKCFQVLISLNVM